MVIGWLYITPQSAVSCNFFDEIIKLNWKHQITIVLPRRVLGN